MNTVRCSVLLVLLAACSDFGAGSRPPTDAEILAAIEEHAHRLVGNAFQGITVTEIKREKPKEQYIADIKSTVMTYPVSFAVHIDTAQGPTNDPPSTTTFYRYGGRWLWLEGGRRPKT